MREKAKAILSNKNFYIGLGGIIIAGILFLLLLNSVIMPDYTNYDEGVTVPNITRMSLKNAQKTLAASGLRYEVADRRSNAAYPADYVIDQNPIPSEIVKPDRKIYLTVNIVANPTVEVPKVTDLSFRNAKIQLQNAGLEVGVVSYESSRFKNTVLRQSIEPHKTVKKGMAIDLAVSDGLGEKMVDIPNIIGKRLSDVQNKLRQIGLRIGEIKFQPSKDVTPNTILDYIPKKKQLIEGEALQLIVSERFDAKEENESGAIVDSTTFSKNDSTLQNNL